MPKIFDVVTVKVPPEDLRRYRARAEALDMSMTGFFREACDAFDPGPDFKPKEINQVRATVDRFKMGVKQVQAAEIKRVVGDMTPGSGAGVCAIHGKGPEGQSVCWCGYRLVAEG